MFMRLLSAAIAVLLLTLGGSANAEIKFYQDNGVGSDIIQSSTNLCPPVQTTLGVITGFAQLEDNGLGTVTLHPGESRSTIFIDFGPEQLTEIFGPGAFVFIDSLVTTTTGAPHESNSSGIGMHGPSSTAPGTSTEWGIISGYLQTGRNFCASSPVSICNQAGFAHGSTAAPVLPSSTYDLGTWSFDAEGDYSMDTAYIQRTSNGGLTNTRFTLRGAFVGANLPALPLIGFAALAVGLATIGARSLMGKK